MLFFKIPLVKIQTLLILFLIFSNINNVWASNFITRGHYVIDLAEKIEWLTCPVGMVWQNGTCLGTPVKLKFNQIKTAIDQANQQLGGNWRLPNRKELENLVCKSCETVKIDTKIFPNTPAESFWTSETNPWQPKFLWTVNFFTGHTFGRFPPFIPNFVRLVRDR
jgi:hypothetical protein